MVNEYIPLDFIKAKVIGVNPEIFYNNPLLENPKSIYKGELLTKTIFSYKNLKIRVFENNKRIELLGSLHTLYNNGLHNYNDFTKTALETALNKLYEDLNILPSNLYLIHTEWGYNIKPPKPSNYIIDRGIQHNSVNKTVGIDCPIEGKYSQFKHSTMILKVYNKGKQFQLGDEVLRIEIKQTNWSKYRAKGIVTLQDLLEADKSIFFNELIRQWKRLILYDINEQITDEYCKYNTKTFWDELRRNYSNKTFKYHFDKLKKLNKSIGYDTQNKIEQLLIKKGNELQL